MRETSPIELSLIYPFRWKVSFHPLAERVERRTLEWLREIGVVTDEAAAERFRRLTVWAYAGWPFPHGDEKRLETIMGFLALWIFYDDVIEEKDDGLIARIKAAVGGAPDLFEKGGPHYRGWWELGQRYRQEMSPAWMIRHAERFEEWVLAVREESRVSNKVRSDGVLPPASDHLERRALNIGMIPNIDFIEYQMGWELPAAVLKTPEMKALEWVSAEVVAITNDLFSFHKDRKNRWCNLVPCLAREGRLPLEEAFRRGVDMHNERVLIIDRLGRRLVEKFPEYVALATWLERLHHIMYGFARWHAIASRYDSSFELESGESLTLGVREFDDEPRPFRRPAEIPAYA